MKRILLVVPALVLVASSLAARQPPAAPAPANVVVNHARIWGHPDADTVVVQAGKIQAVGKGLKPAKGVKMIDAKGGWVLPGFHDAHIHMLGGGLTMVRVQLAGETTLDGTLKAIKDYAAAHPDRPWILGRGFSYDIVPKGQFPTRQMLDAVVKDRPVFVRAYDGHSGWANTKAITLAGITAKTADPADGKIIRDKDGTPTGAFLEGAQELLDKVIPQPTREEKKAALLAAARACASMGITSVLDLAYEPITFELWRELDTEGNLPLHVAVGLPLEGNLDDYHKMRETPPTPHVRFGALKAFIDGVFDSRTAFTLEPYAGTKDDVGKPLIEPKRYFELVEAAHARGFQVAVHAVGDGAVRLTLDAFEAAKRKHPTITTRHRIEHIEVVDPADVPRFAKLNVIASMQPYHVIPNEPDPNQGAWVENVGPKRAKMAMAWRSLLDAGAPLAHGSDWPVYTQNPLHGVAMALLRETPRGIPAGGWMPQHKMTLQETIHGYSVERGLAEGPSKDVGRLDVGQRADLVVLTPDAQLDKPTTLWTAGVANTVVDGVVVHAR